MFPDTEVSLMQRAKLRALWSSLQRRGNAETTPAEPLGSPAKQGSGWSEAFAPKLDASRVATLKKRFLEAFPSEILTAMNTPSLRLLSTAVDAEVKRSWSWIPWKSRMTQQMYEDSLMQKLAKRARIETLQLSDLLLDEPPQIDINDSTMGISMIRRLLEVHDNAFALAGTAHLARLKAYTSKFLSLVSQKFPPETNLRPPSVLDAQQADKHLWSCIFQLVIEKEWQVNDAILSTSSQRSAATCHHGCSLVPKRLPPAIVGRTRRVAAITAHPPRRQVVAPARARGKTKNPTKQGTQPKGVQWVREFKEGSQVKKLCIGWQIGKCQRGKSCEFTHGCPKPDGSPCLSKDHGAPTMRSARHHGGMTSQSTAGALRVAHLYFPIFVGRKWKASSIAYYAHCGKPRGPNRFAALTSCISGASSDSPRGLRKALLQFCISIRADTRLLARGSCPSPEPLFSSTEVSAAGDLVFPSLGLQTPDNAWYVHPYQPMCLHAFEALAQHCEDQDTHLFPHLRMGVPTGYLNDIPPSNCFWLPKGQSGELTPLTLNLENWKSAEVAPDVTSRLLQEELDAGYCFKFEGTLEEAKSRWPVGLALGKLGVVRAAGRAERLVLDNSVAGTNSQCSVPERQCFPSIHT
ncbi:unnamed protein product [Symbiodinium sp. CCMP2592]|nr:unnamed protein product [Symbiodinium sp. CCMP2592]